MRKILNINNGLFFHLDKIEIVEPFQKGQIYSSSKSETLCYLPRQDITTTCGIHIIMEKQNDGR